jgi:hypothetical protein
MKTLSVVGSISMVLFLVAATYAGMRQGLAWYFAAPLAMLIMGLVISLEYVRDRTTHTLLLAIVCSAALVYAIYVLRS